MAELRQSSSLHERVVPFTAGDGFACNLINVRGEHEPTKGPVILIHGAGVRANIFRAPVETTIVDYLVEHGYDVWLENWRASIDFSPNEWTLDQAALYDHPRAVETVAAETGYDTFKALIHCQGSTSFMMSAIAGLVPQIETIVTNAVSLHPIVRDMARPKLRFAVPLVALITKYLDPQWGLEAPTLPAKIIDALVRLTHHEDESAVSKHVSFTYGVGWPTLWNHDNLNDATQDWLQHEFAHVPLRFFKQMARCVKKGNLIAYETLPGLPADYAAEPAQTDARIAFFAGEDNRCFRYESQVQSYKYFDNLRKDYHSLHVVPRYGHLDMFMGQHAARDVFPLMLAELDKPT